MRVIEKRDEHEVPCKECNSLLGITFDDLKENNDFTLFFKCAVCCSKNMITFSELPNRWKVKFDVG